MNILERFSYPYFTRFTAALLLALLTSCIGPKLIIQSDNRAGHPIIFDPKPIVVQHGKASYYWQDYMTASGERFYPEALTAAHRTFKLQSWIRVTNKRNGKPIVVRINDRGPYVHGRIVDLSRGAARRIDMIQAGVVPVKVELLRRIDLIEKPNLQITSKTRAKAEARSHAASSLLPMH